MENQQDMISRIMPLVNQFKDLQSNAEAVYRPLVDDIVRSNCNDVARIEHVLDGLVSFASDGEGLRLFKVLCRHLYSFDSQNAASHVMFWKEMWDTDVEDVAQHEKV